MCNSPFHSSWKVTKPLYETEAKVVLAQLEIIRILKKLVGMSIISTSQTVQGQPLPQFHVEAWLPFRNREMDY